MTTFNELERKRISKINNLNESELNDYIDLLVFGMEKSMHNLDLPNLTHYIDLLKELKEIWGAKSNIKEIINYTTIVYKNAYMSIRNYEKEIEGIKELMREMCNTIDNFKNHGTILIRVLGIYYKNYSHKKSMNMLLEHLTIDEKVKLSNKVKEKYLNNPDIVDNKLIMKQLDSLIIILRDLILEDVKLLKSYIESIKILNIPNRINLAHEQIRAYKTNENLREIRKCGGIDLSKRVIELLKVLEPMEKHMQDMVKDSDNLFNGVFEEIVGNDYEFNKEYYPLSVDGISKEEFIAKAPKYDVMNAKFIKS